MMVIPEATLQLLITLLNLIQPELVIENGCGWSTFALVRWGIEHDVPVHIFDDDAAWAGQIKALLAGKNLTARWIGADELLDVTYGTSWAALVDGTIEGRKRFSLEIFPVSRRGLILFDDANAAYAQAAIRPLMTHDGGCLVNLRPITEEQRNQTTWAALWVGNRVNNRAEIMAWLEDQGCV